MLAALNGDCNSSVNHFVAAADVAFWTPIDDEQHASPFVAPSPLPDASKSEKENKSFLKSVFNNNCKFFM